MVTLATSRYSVSPIHLHALLSGKFYGGGPCVCQPPMKWSATAESLGSTALEG
jgi:hypothetical protein